MSILIRPLESPADMAAAVGLQQAVWTGSDLEVIPAHMLLTVAHNGGLVAGAFLGQRCIGLVWGFLGLDQRVDPPRPKHCSHQLGVHPDYRSAGLGFDLKHFQWRFVRAQGLDLITWTYDPLLARNAQLNIAKLGAICNTYLRNTYGDLQDDLNAGLPTDRFQVDWWVNSPRVVERMTVGASARPTLANYLAADAVLLNPPDTDGVSVPPAGLTTATYPATVLVEIPRNFLDLKAADPGLALAWRLGTRAAFEDLFARGYIIDDFVRDAARAVYVLRAPRAPLVSAS